MDTNKGKGERYVGQPPSTIMDKHGVVWQKMPAGEFQVEDIYQSPDGQTKSFHQIEAVEKPASLGD